jgi:hypothetical protein
MSLYYYISFFLMSFSSFGKMIRVSNPSFTRLFRRHLRMTSLNHLQGSFEQRINLNGNDYENLKRTEFLNIKPELQDKKLICLSPGGFRGIYALGTCKYITDNYDISNYYFSGASAGAWNSLYMACKKPDEFLSLVLSLDISKVSSLLEVQHVLKMKLLDNFSSSDFHMDLVYICVTLFDDMRFTCGIFGDFEDLKDIIDCCIASSHIPFVTGGFLNQYKDHYAFDGGFTKYPYINTSIPVITITPDMWKCTDHINSFDFQVFQKNSKYLVDIFQEGYDDAQKNKDILDKVFT